jgi:hypothetical protein
MLDRIERLVTAGFAVHLLHPKSKRPIGNDWSEKPVASIALLRKTYKAGMNVGVRLGKWSKVGDLFLHVVDLDIRNPDLADEARERLTELFGKWEKYPIVISGSGGSSRHVYFLTDKPFSSKKLAHSKTFSMVWEEARQKEVKKWDWEIELFGTGKQVAMPPSIHPDTGKPYRWLAEFDFDDLDLGFGPIVPSSRIEELVGAEDESEASDERSQPLGLSIDEAEEILGDLPESEFREDRDGWLTVGMALHHEFGGSDEAFKIWCEFSKLSDKFDRKDQKRVWKSFKGKAKPVRMATLKNAAREARLMDEFENLDDTEDDDDVFEDLGEEPGDDFDDLLGGSPAQSDPVSKRQQKLNKADVEAELGHVPPKIKRLNRKHAVAFVNGKTVIITEKRDGTVAYGTVGDLHNYYENDRVATDKATEPVTKAWMRHKKRREFPEGIVFAPGQEVEGAYNHWRGFAVEPDPDASCKLILAHLKRVICDNDEKAFRYALGWWAHLVQFPEEKPGVAMVLRGKKGAGKDTIADYIGGLIPHHHVKIANQEQLVGKFNAHQEKCLLLHVEEGFWAGNKNAEGALKHLITSEKVFIEPKGLNGFHVASVLRLFMSSNEDWVVPATEDERRYFVLDVPSTKKGDFVYFTALRTEMKNGGRAALLHYLLNYDLSGFNVRDVPDTAALAQQKLQGLKNIERWWFSLLETGELPFDAMSDSGNRAGNWPVEPVMVERDDFRDAYKGFMRSRRYDGDELQPQEIGRRITALLPSIDTRRKRIDGKAVYHYILPHLDQCRREFERYLQSELMWDTIDTHPVEDEHIPEESDDDIFN